MDTNLACWKEAESDNGGCYSVLRLMISGVLQGPAQGPLMFVLSVNDFDENGGNFADDNTIGGIVDSNNVILDSKGL